MLLGQLTLHVHNGLQRMVGFRKGQVERCSELSEQTEEPFVRNKGVHEQPACLVYSSPSTLSRSLSLPLSCHIRCMSTPTRNTRDDELSAHLVFRNSEGRNGAIGIED